MAGDWFPVEIDLPDKRQVWAMHEALQIDVDAVVGKLIRVWGWFDRHTENGHAPSVTVSRVDELVRVTGFAEAMKSVGWLIASPSGLTIPEFEEHHGSGAKKRLAAAKRQQKHRAAKAAVVTPERDKKRDAGVTKGVTTEQNRTSKSQELSIVGSGDPTLAGFELFWSIYPVKEAKAKARRHWNAKQLDTKAETIVADVRKRSAEHGKWLDGFIPMPTTYLNQERWNDAINPKRENDRKAPSANGGKATQAIQSLLDDTLPNPSHPNAPRLTRD